MGAERNASSGGKVVVKGEWVDRNGVSVYMQKTTLVNPESATWRERRAVRKSNEWQKRIASGGRDDGMCCCT